MARIQSSILSKAINFLKLDPARERIPNEVADKVLITFPIGYDQPDKNNQIIVQISSTTANGVTNVYTIDSNKDRNFYLCSIDCSYANNSAGTADTFRVEGIPIGQSAQVGFIQFQFDAAAAVKQSAKNIVYNRPIVLEPGTVIRMGNNCAAGTCVQRCTITGFYA
jgi:hypothetical protein